MRWDLGLLSTAANIRVRIKPKERVIPPKIKRSDLGFMARFAVAVDTFDDSTF